MDKRYSQFIQIIKVTTALVLWFGFSVTFSTDGFGFIIPNRAWMGIVLAVVVTALELILLEEGLNSSLTIIIVCSFAYAYGMITNVLGIVAMRGGSFDPGGMAFAIVLGVLIEIAPEPLLVSGLGIRGRDFLEHIFPKNT